MNVLLQVQIVDATDRGLYGKQVTVQVQPHGQTSILPDNQNAYQAILVKEGEEEKERGRERSEGNREEEEK